MAEYLDREGLAHLWGKIKEKIDIKVYSTIKETNKGEEFRFWIGTMTEFQSLSSTDNSTLYLILDYPKAIGIIDVTLTEV